MSNHIPRTLRGLLRLVPAVALLASAAAPASAQSDTTGSQEKQIVISKNAVPKIQLLLEDFLAAPGAAPEDARSVHDVVSTDLDYADIFSVTPIPRMGEGDTLNAVQARFLVRGEVRVTSGNLVLRGTLESLPARSLVFSRDYATPPENYREAAHRFSDDVVLYVTGRPGIARTRIAFISNRSGGKEVYTVDYDGFGVKQATRNGSINMSPDWFPGGGSLVYVSYAKGDPDLFRLDLGSGKNGLLAGGQGVQSAPAVSGDGSRIAYSQTNGTESEIYVCGPDGGGSHRVTRFPGINTSPAWSPDSRQIAFTSDRAGTPQLYVMDSDGGGARRLTFDGQWNDQADWSPDGDRIVYSSRRDGLFRITVVGVGGMGSERQLTRGPGSDEHARWAPDARHVVFTSTRGGRRGLYVLDVDGGRVRPVAVGGGDNYAPDWSASPPR